MNWTEQQYQEYLEYVAKRKSVGIANANGEAQSKGETTVSTNGAVSRLGGRQAPAASRKSASFPTDQTKYHSKKETVDNIVFDSKKEAARYRELTIMLKAGVIADLRLQPEYPFLINGVKIFSYYADFDYVSKECSGRRKVVVEDVKGFKTPVYRLKRKIIEAFYGIEITEMI